MFCRNCMHEVDERAIVCVACGCPPRVGVKFCHYCGAETSPGARMCLKCGVPMTGSGGAAGKSRTAYVLLGALLGLCLPGIHNFYIGRTGAGIAQLLMTILSCWILWIPAYIWTVVEVCTVTQDSDGNPLV